MRSFLLTAALVAAIPAHANEPTPIEFCSEMANLAEVVMRKRQEGVAMTELLKAAQSSDATGAFDLTVGMIQIAYEQPRWNTHENQRNAVRDFADSWMVQCLRSRGGD